MSSEIVVHSMYFAEHHRPRTHHPENPGRLLVAVEAARSAGWPIREMLARCDPEELTRIHYPGYIEYVKRLSEDAPAEIDPDTYVVEDTYEAALAAACTSMEAALETMVRGWKTIVLLRPPGHHAGRGGKAMGAPTQGFCIFNNAAAAAAVLAENMWHVAVLDFDIHHGNGTQEIFYRDDSVLHVDIHRDPSDFYPYTGFPRDTGTGRGRGFTVNIPLPTMSGDDVYLEALSIAEAVISQYEPSILVYSMGFDGYMGDGLADTHLSEATYCRIGLLGHRLGVPVLGVLEGGYSVGLRRGLSAFLHGLGGGECGFRVRRSSRWVWSYANRLFKEVRMAIGKYWDV